jgi:hypothetical protein
LKTKNIKVVHPDKTYNFAFWTIFKFFLHFEIWIGGWKWVKFKICIFSKLLQILYWNFENSKYQNCTTWQDLQFCFLAHPQIIFRFWITQKGVNRVFRKTRVLNQIQTWFGLYINWWLIYDHNYHPNVPLSQITLDLPKPTFVWTKFDF